MARKKRTSLFHYYQAPSSDSTPLPCAEGGCDASGFFKALDPWDESRPPQFLCERHIKAHNESINFYHDMTPEQIEHYTREDMKWRNPTWPLGIHRRRFPFLYKNIQFGPDSLGSRASVEPPKPLEVPDTIQQALVVLSVTFPITMTELKKTYKEMVKKYHPDANRHLDGAEDKIKAINTAYATLRQFLESQ